MKEFGTGRSIDHGSFIVDRRGTILGFDERMEQLTGWPAVDVVGRSKNLGGAITNGPLYDGDVPIVAGSKPLSITLRCRDGRRIEVDSVARRMKGPGERVMVTALRILARSATDMAEEFEQGRDALTGLPNSSAFDQRLEADFESAGTTARPLALVLADIDRLREINDTLGHDAGDEVLQKFAGILRVAVSDESRIFRLGDDDFAILLPDSGRGEARQFAAALRSTVERYRFFRSGGGTADPRITLSLGAASFPADCERAHELVERARDALDEARTMGRNRVWCYLRRPRVPVEVPVFFDGAESLLVGYTRDLSPSGIFVQTSAPVDIGMRCALAFPLPGLEGKVHVIGRVVRTVPAEQANEEIEVRIPGMGVEFERFGGSHDRRTIDAFLHRNETTSLRPESGPLSFPDD